MLETGPIIRAMLRRPAGPLLIILQLAITIAIVSNSLSFIQQRSEFINREPGLEVEGLMKIWAKQDETRGDIDNTIEEDLRFLKDQSSVESAIAINGLPMGGMGGTSGFATAPTMDVEGQQVLSAAASVLQVTEGWLDVLGVNLIQGEDFTFDDYQRYRQENTPTSSPIILTETVAEQLFPDQNPIGQSLYMGELVSFTVVGVIENMFGHQLYWEWPYHTVIFPKLSLSDSTMYLIRTNESNEELVLNDLVAELRKLNDTRIVGDEKTMTTIARDTYSGDYAMITLLSIVVVLLIGVNALGVVGLTSFWISQRRRQIGIRRALGASKTAIVRYFLLENIMLVAGAVLVGGIAAISASIYMVKAYGFEPLAWFYIPASALVVLLITLGAAIFPVNKASQISPVEAVAGR
tara:strand:- start:2685 stop:3908 length:1224 start_codon:yes stop_codon:yes gene_type:complete